jgi:hypothetical protein
MTPIADMIEKMTAEGVPMHVILLAVKTAEMTAVRGNSGGIPVDKTAEKRRAYDRERKAEKKLSGGIPVEIPRNSQSASSLLLSEKEKEEVDRETIRGNSGGKSEQRKVGRQLPDDWRPSESHFAEGAALHRTRDQVEAKAEEMRLWAQANGHRAVARKLDWDAAFRGWMRRDWGKPNGAAPMPRSGIEGII